VISCHGIRKKRGQNILQNLSAAEAPSVMDSPCIMAHMAVKSGLVVPLLDAVLRKKRLPLPENPVKSAALRLRLPER